MEIVGRTLAGLETVLHQEIENLGGTEIIIGKRAVLFQGDLELLYKINLHCRTAISFLTPIIQFKARDKDTLYQQMRGIAWDQYFKVDQTFMIKPIVKSNFFKHSKYAALICKDAMVDFFSDKYGQRPNISTKEPQIVFILKIHKDEITFSLDSSGLPLNRRGYRVHQGPAPMNEVLAAGLILLSQWDYKQTNFLDPMCGGGTIAIEAAMLAANIPPQALRRSFAFQHWPNYDSTLWNRIRRDWEEVAPNVSIFARDQDFKAVQLARMHAEQGELENYITFEQQTFQSSQSDAPLHIIMNPPYDERIDHPDVMQLYSEIGSTLKHQFPGSEAWILSANLQALHKIGLRPSKKLTLYNGQLECKYQKYELFKGKRAKRHQRI